MAATASDRCESFPPLLGARPRVLILGSMPGAVSLRAGQYYGHPRNLFWPLLAEVLGFDAAAPYAQRTAELTARGVALWDVLRECQRPGSLDSRIRRDSEQANDVAGLLRANPSIVAVLLNGTKAAEAFRRHAAGRLPDLGSWVVHCLPSTSPANAAVPRQERRARWRAALAAHLEAALATQAESNGHAPTPVNAIEPSPLISSRAAGRAQEPSSPRSHRTQA